ncbi:hypothetical protein ACJX0J_017952, partial [Zea mays]
MDSGLLFSPRHIHGRTRRLPHRACGRPLSSPGLPCSPRFLRRSRRPEDTVCGGGNRWRCGGGVHGARGARSDTLKRVALLALGCCTVAAALGAARAVAGDSIKASGFGLWVAELLRRLGWHDDTVVFALATPPVIELRGAIPLGIGCGAHPHCPSVANPTRVASTAHPRLPSSGLCRKPRTRRLHRTPRPSIVATAHSPSTPSSPQIAQLRHRWKSPRIRPCGRGPSCTICLPLHAWWFRLHLSSPHPLKANCIQMSRRPHVIFILVAPTTIGDSRTHGQVGAKKKQAPSPSWKEEAIPPTLTRSHQRRRPHHPRRKPPKETFSFQTKDSSPYVDDHRDTVEEASGYIISRMELARQHQQASTYSLSIVSISKLMKVDQVHHALGEAGSGHWWNQRHR